MLTQEQQQKFQDHVRRINNGNMRCSACGSNQFEADQYVHRTSLVVGSAVQVGPSVDLLRVVCRQCFQSIWFEAGPVLEPKS